MKDEHTHAATTSKEQAAEPGSGSTGSPRPHVISRRVFSTRSAWTLALLLAATVFIIDQGTKYLVVTRPLLRGCCGGTQSVIPVRHSRSVKGPPGCSPLLWLSQR